MLPFLFASFSCFKLSFTTNTIYNIFCISQIYLIVARKPLGLYLLGSSNQKENGLPTSIKLIIRMVDVIVPCGTITFRWVVEQNTKSVEKPVQQHPMKS